MSRSLDSLGTLVTPTNFILSLLSIFELSQFFKILRRRAHTTKLSGPLSPSWLFGVGHILRATSDAASMYEGWSRAYGYVYALPAAFGTQRIILMDHKAIAHFCARDTYGYGQMKQLKVAVQALLGNGILTAEGKSHKRQRKTLTPAFSNVSIRQLTPIFYDSGYKVKAAWDALIEAGTTDESLIEVQTWMNNVSLDSIGLAGFAHDFNTLRGEKSTVAELLDTLSNSVPSTLQGIIFVLAPVVPWLMKLPTYRRRMIRKLNRRMGEIVDVMLDRSRKVGGENDLERSVIGLLLKAEKNAEVISQDEIMAQIKGMIMAGYETTSISLTWALIELSKNQEIQTKLRDELVQFGAVDPTWDQLTNSLPYLDAVVQETLRTHPPVLGGTRLAMEDDVVPLGTPTRAADGSTVDRIAIARRMLVTVPIAAIQLSEDVWGPDAKIFKPERWLADDKSNAARPRELAVHRSLLAFFDGPRKCLGQAFALAEFKAVLSVLIRNFAFELRDGPDTKIKTKVAILPRPAIEGEEGTQVPLRVRRLA